MYKKKKLTPQSESKQNNKRSDKDGLCWLQRDTCRVTLKAQYKALYKIIDTVLTFLSLAGLILMMILLKDD